MYHSTFAGLSILVRPLARKELVQKTRKRILIIFSVKATNFIDLYSQGLSSDK